MSSRCCQCRCSGEHASGHPLLIPEGWLRLLDDVGGPVGRLACSAECAAKWSGWQTIGAKNRGKS